MRSSIARPPPAIGSAICLTPGLDLLKAMLATVSFPRVGSQRSNAPGYETSRVCISSKRRSFDEIASSERRLFDEIAIQHGKRAII